MLGEPLAYQGEQDVVAAGEVAIGKVRGVLDLIREPAHGHRIPAITAGHVERRGQDRLPRGGPFPFPTSLGRCRLEHVPFVSLATDLTGQLREERLPVELVPVLDGHPVDDAPDVDRVHHHRAAGGR